jgi:Holliday junction resolvasome RuvABC endonuclease subunit
MILGIDVSTSITGFSIVDHSGNLVNFSNTDLRKHKDFFVKSVLVKEHLLDLYEKYDITDVYIEKPFAFFSSGGSSAATMAKLQKFNGVVSWISFEVFQVRPEYLTAGQARKLVGISVPRGKKAKKVVMEHLIEHEPDFEVEWTRNGNPKPCYFDMADAIVVAKAGFESQKKEVDEAT